MVREKEKLRSDLDKAEKLKSLMASEVDDHHAAIERRNAHNLRCGWWVQAPPAHPPGPGQWGSACRPTWPHLAGVTRLWQSSRKAEYTRYPLALLPFSGTPCFHFWWITQGSLKDPVLIFPPHRKLDEEYKERIAALKNELRKEREQIVQQVGKQRAELEQEIEKAKTEENYVRDRLALSLKVIILLVLWSVCCR